MMIYPVAFSRRMIIYWEWIQYLLSNSTALFKKKSGKPTDAYPPLEGAGGGFWI